MRRPLGVVGLGVATMVAVGLNVPSAGAEASSALSLLAPTNATSTGLAGYVLKAPASATGATTFTVPALKCTATQSGIELGAFVVGTTGFTGAGVFAVCQGGTALFAGILNVPGKQVVTAFTPAPGDVVVVSASESAGKSRASLKDLKQVKSAALSGGGASNVAILEGISALINNTTNQQLPVPSFGKVPYSKASADGKTLKAAGATAVNMETATHVLQIQTSLLGSTGNTFSETFKHA
jgi:hypothetical protein